jgi:hypothetical protein
MSTSTTEIVVRTKHDQWTRQSAAAVIQYCLDHMRDELDVVEVMLDLTDSHRPTTLADVVEYAVDCLNDTTPHPDLYYYVTADCDLAFDNGQES